MGSEFNSPKNPVGDIKVMGGPAQTFTMPDFNKISKLKKKKLIKKRS